MLSRQKTRSTIKGNPFRKGYPCGYKPLAVATARGADDAYRAICEADVDGAHVVELVGLENVTLRIDLYLETIIAVRKPCDVDRLAVELVAVGVTPTHRHALHLISAGTIDRLLRRSWELGIHARSVHHAECHLATYAIFLTVCGNRLERVRRIIVEVEMIVRYVPRKGARLIFRIRSVVIVNALEDILTVADHIPCKKF